MNIGGKSTTGRALVLGSGGITGIAWELGVLAGLAERGVDLGDADLVVGTSAGAVVGAQVAAGLDVRERYEHQLKLVETEGEVPRASPLAAFRLILALVGARGDGVRFRTRIGRMALAAKTPPEAERRAVVAGYLGEVRTWPERRLLITAVDAESGEFVTFDSGSGAGLLDAVAASTAGPGMRPPATIAGRRYVDGGMRSPVNADLATGHDRVVVLAPVVRGGGPIPNLGDQLAELGAEVLTVVISPDKAARKIMGEGMRMLDPARRAAAARAGHAQAAAVAAAVARLWHDQNR